MHRSFAHEQIAPAAKLSVQRRSLLVCSHDCLMLLMLFLRSIVRGPLPRAAMVVVALTVAAGKGPPPGGYMYRAAVQRSTLLVGRLFVGFFLYNVRGQPPVAGRPVHSPVRAAPVIVGLREGGPPPGG
eukprot:9415589-Pyramimonas_sp.AAC.1